MTYFQYGPIVDGSAFDVTAFTTIVDLIPGQVYALVSDGGPWAAPFGAFYGLQLQGGTATLHEEPADDGIHNRVFFMAPGTTVQCSVADGGGPYFDNIGALNWGLYLAFNDATVGDIAPAVDLLRLELAACCAEILAAVRRTF